MLCPTISLNFLQAANNKAREFYELFGCIGEIVGVSIAPRLKKFGKKFFFARFSNVEDSQLLGVKVDNLQVEGKKIHANFPRFARGRTVSGGNSNKGFVGKTHPYNLLRRLDTVGADSVSAQRKDARSFKEVVINTVSAGDNKVMMFTTNPEDRARFSKVMVGEVKIPGSTYELVVAFHLAGIFSIKVSILGPNLCLLEESVEGVMKELTGEEESKCKDWFAIVRIWKEEDADVEILVTLSVFGVSCVVWNLRYFEILGNFVGSFVRWENWNGNNNRFRLRLNHSEGEMLLHSSVVYFGFNRWKVIYFGPFSRFLVSKS